MPTYEYETIPQRSDESPVRFELSHSMTDPAPTSHPETGQPIRRVYAAFNVGGAQSSGSAQPAHTHTGGCCCNPGGACDLG